MSTAMPAITTLVQALHRWPALILLAAAGVVAPVLFLCNPATTAFFPPCPVRLLTGWLCPGCGTLRAAHQLLRGNVAAALALNPLLVLGSPFLGAAVLAQGWGELGGKTARVPVVSGGGAWALLALTLAYAVLRNTPLWPL